MLACLQPQTEPPRHLMCAAKILHTPVSHTSETSTMRSPRYPSTAELDAYAQRTADSPLSIKIFPTNIRVPQHKQINRTVNGLDTSGQRFSPFSHPYSGGYQGLLATVRTSTATKSVLKSSNGKRTKLSPIQMAVAPYAAPINHCIANRHRQLPYNVGLCQAPEAPNVPSVVMATFAVSDCSSHRIIQQTRYPSNGQCGETHSNPSFFAATAASNPESGFAVSGYSRAVLPTQSADVTKAVGHVDGLDYRQHEQRRAQQYYPQGSLRMYSGSGDVISGSPEVIQLSHRSRTLRTATRLTDGMPDKATSSPLNCTAMHGDFLVKRFFAPPWNGVLATPGSDYSSQEVGRGHPHLHSHTGRPQPYPMDRRLSLGLSCGMPGKSTCQASLLSSSLQSLECLISEIHPPCIKERMLGRDYDVLGVPKVFDHHAPVQLPVLR